MTGFALSLFHNLTVHFLATRLCTILLYRRIIILRVWIIIIIIIIWIIILRVCLAIFCQVITLIVCVFTAVWLSSTGWRWCCRRNIATCLCAVGHHCRIVSRAFFTMGCKLLALAVRVYTAVRVVGTGWRLQTLSTSNLLCNLTAGPRTITIDFSIRAAAGDHLRTERVV